MLNDNDMIIDIIKEHAKIKENENMTSEHLLACARRAEVQKAKSSILKNLNETKDFDKTSTSKGVQRHIEVQM